MNLSFVISLRAERRKKEGIFLIYLNTNGKMPNDKKHYHQNSPVAQTFPSVKKVRKLESPTAAGHLLLPPSPPPPLHEMKRV